MIIPLLRDDKTGLAMDDSGVSWFGALLPAGSIVGSFIPGKYVFDSFLDDFNLENYKHGIQRANVAALVLRRYGCKRPLLAFALIQIVAFVMIAAASKKTVALAHLGRTLSGLAVGGSVPIGKSRLV